MSVNNQHNRTILLLHQSASLYGSDKTLLELALAIKADKRWTPIVVLPFKGPLVDKLQENGITVVDLPVLKVSRDLLHPKNLWKLPFRIYKELNDFKVYFKDYKVDVIHSNTLAVLIGAFVYKSLKAKHIWHVHEMIEKPSFVKEFYRYLLPNKSDIIIANSKATEAFWLDNRKPLQKKFRLVYNGLDLPKDKLRPSIAAIKEKLFHIPVDGLVIGLVGRINQYKGHDLLLKTFEELSRRYPQIYLVMIGSTPPGKAFYKTELKNKIDQVEAKDSIRLIDFQEDIAAVWSAIDIAVVPTIIAESFGLVALEAMLAKKPVIASAIGGLVEVVDDEETGYLFEPENAQMLTEKLELLINNDSLRESMGARGYKKATEQFKLENYTQAILDIYSEMIEKDI
ncbi:glycosyltransferase [Flavobacteriaceae bacterium Ap0902]|nr:glycosyltransferase [Flavobacteriaceae bacterium Ap0902]